MSGSRHFTVSSNGLIHDSRPPGARPRPIWGVGGPDLEAKRKEFGKNQKSLRDICEEIEQRDADQRGISTYDEAKHT